MGQSLKKSSTSKVSRGAAESRGGIRKGGSVLKEDYSSTALTLLLKREDYEKPGKKGDILFDASGFLSFCGNGGGEIDLRWGKNEFRG